MTAWTVRVDLGDGTLVLEGSLDQWTDPSGPAPTLPALESVRWTDSLEEGPWPRRQGVSTGSVQFVVAQASDAAWIGPTTSCWVQVLTPASVDPVAEFAGRCSDPVLSQHDQGVRVVVGLTDYLSDLAEYTAGTVAYPIETNKDRVGRMFLEADLAVDAPGLGFWTYYDALAARSAEPADLLTLTQAVMEGSMWGFLDFDPVTGALFINYELLEVRPDVVDGLLDRWTTNVLEQLPESGAPLRLVEVAGVWELQADPAAVPALVVDADQVAFDATWSRRTDRVADTVEVVLADGSVVRVTNWDGVGVPSTVRRETALTDTTDAAQLAAYLLEPAIGPTSPSGWEAERFQVLLDDTPDALVPFALRQVVAVGGIPPARHPEGLAYYVGVVESRDFQASGNSLTLDVSLAAQASTPGPDAITWDQVGVLGPTWDDLAADTTITWDRLADTRD